MKKGIDDELRDIVHSAAIKSGMKDLISSHRGLVCDIVLIFVGLDDTIEAYWEGLCVDRLEKIFNAILESLPDAERVAIKWKLDKRR